MTAFGPWYGDTATLSIKVDSTDIPVGSLQNVEVSIDVGNRTEYFSNDTTLREAVRHSEIVPVVDFTLGSFDIALVKEFMAGGNDGSSITKLSDEDTTVPQKYDISASLEPVEVSDGSAQALEVTVEGCDLDGIPLFSAERGDFIGNEYSARGDDLVIDQEPEVV